MPRGAQAVCLSFRGADRLTTLEPPNISAMCGRSKDLYGKRRIGPPSIARRIPLATAGALQNFTELAQSGNPQRPRCRSDLPGAALDSSESGPGADRLACL